LRILRKRDFGKKRAAHRLLLRIGPAALQHIREPLLRWLVELADTRPHVCHIGLLLG
jgi:hypothetical protein